MSTITITNENFEKEVTQSQIPVLVDFWAPWCGPCKMLSPIVDEIANELGDKIKVGKINVDEQMELSTKFKIMSIPTLVLFQQGKVEKILVGLRSKEEILAMIK